MNYAIIKVKGSIIMMKNSIKLVLSIFLLTTNIWYGNAQLTTSTENVSFNSCGDNLPDSELNLGNLVFTEAMATDFEAGTYTFYIEAPTNYTINAGAILKNGSDLISVSAIQDTNNASRLKVTVTANAQTSLDVITLENVRIQLISPETTTDGKLKYSLDGNTNNINGLEDGDVIATVGFTPLSGGNGVNQQVCALSNVQAIGITGSNITQSRNYVWEKEVDGNWTTITDSNYETLPLTIANVTNGINKYRRSTNFNLNGQSCTQVSTTATITVNQITPGRITQGASQTICTGETPEMLSTPGAGDLAVTPGGEHNYQWYRNYSGSWEEISNATENFYQPPALSITTSYKRRVTNVLNGFSCYKETPSITITVSSSVLGGTVSDQNICSLDQLQLLTVNNGDNGTYQWQKRIGEDWEDINGATNINYNAANNLSHGVQEFRRITTIPGASCQGISTIATITNTNFTVGSITGAQTICYNQVPSKLTSETNASGSGTISYQWEQFDDNGWMVISGANNEEYQPTALTQTTRYRRQDKIELNGHNCFDFSNEIEIIVLQEIQGGIASSDQTLCSGEYPESITVINGTSPGTNITYQWQSMTTGNFTNINGETSATLSFANTLETTTTFRRQTIISSNNSVCYENSTESTVYINHINVGTIGKNQDVCEGQQPATIIALGPTTSPGNLNYAWEASTDNGLNWTTIPGATETTYTPGVLSVSTMFRRMDSSTYKGKVCSKYTNEVTINVAGAISGGESSEDQVICEGEAPASITITNGTEAGTGISFQWYSSTDNINYTVINGETGENLNFANGLTTSTYFKRHTTNTNNGFACEAFSTPTLVTLLSLTPGSIADTQTVCGTENIPPLISIENATSNGAITYSWQSSTDGEIWEDIANENQPTYTPINSGEIQTYYRRVATSTIESTSCEAITTPILVYLNKFQEAENHKITFSSGGIGSTTVCNEGDPQPFSVNFPLIASGELTYQWQISEDNISFTDIAGATDSSYDPPIVMKDNYYRRITTSTLNGVSCSHTSNVLLILNGGNATGGTIGTTNANGSNGTNEEVICKGDIPSEIEQLEASTGDDTITHQWFANGSLIPGATNVNYIPTNPVNKTTTYIRATTNTDINGVECTVNSNPITVLVPQADNLGPDITLCYNDTLPPLGNISAIEGLPYLNFQWYESNDNIVFTPIVGATNATYSPGSVLTADKYYRRDYQATVDNIICGPYVQSNVIRVFINDVDGGTIYGDQKICFGDDPSLLGSTVDGTADGVLKYQWYSSIDNATWGLIKGAINGTYDPKPGNYPTTYFKRTTISTLNRVVCKEDSNIIVVQVADEILPGTLSNDQTICEGNVPNTLSVSGASNFPNQSYKWLVSTDGNTWTDTGATTATYTPPTPTETKYYKRTISRTTLGDITCTVETNPVKISYNMVNAGIIADNQSVCMGDQPLAIVELESATAAGMLTYQWWSSEDNQTYNPVTNAKQPNFTPPTTLTKSTYYKRVVTSTLNEVACSDETSPILVTVIPYPIINNDLIIANDITDVSCFGGNDGSIIIPNGRITGGNSAQKQINTISLFGNPTLGNKYSLIINGIAYEHQVTLNGINQPQNNNEVAAALSQKVNSATGASTSAVSATTNYNEIILTAKVEGISFTVYASTGSDSNVSASNVLTQANGVANTYEWTKVGDPSFTASTLSISNLHAGVYQLTVYNEFCGITSLPFLVSEPEKLTLTIGDTCNTVITANSTGGVAPFTFTLTRPNGTTMVQTSNNPNVTYTDLTGGANYTVTVQDASCDVSVSQAVTLPMGLNFDEASVEVKNVSCFGQSDGSISLNIGATTVTGGFPPYNFSWTGPNNTTYTTENIKNLLPGVYVLSVTDQIGCSTTYTANVASKGVLEFSSVQVVNEQLQCAGDSNAEINIQIKSDPSSQLQINWFKNGTSYATNTTNINNLGGGTYEVVVTDTNSDPNAPCTIRKTFSINAPEVFDAYEGGLQSTSCFDPNVGRSFTIVVQGGTAPYQYTLDNETAVLFNTKETTINGLNSDSHIITVTDANQCKVKSFSLDAYQALTYTGIKDVTLAPCEADYDFVLDTNFVTGGTPFTDANNTPFYLYDWTGPNNFNAQDVTSFTAIPGTYTLTITDSKDCTSQQIQFNFKTTYPPIVVNKDITSVSCGSTNDGAISIAVSGGSRPYSIIWEKEVAGNPNAEFVTIGQNITQLSNLEEGRYRLTVTSSIDGCTKENPSYYYREIIHIKKTESLKLLDGPYLDESLCLGNPGKISVSIFNTQGGDLSFYYNNALMPSVKTATDTYNIQIATPVENATLNVVNDQGCGFILPINTGVADPVFSYSSAEFEITGLLLAKEDIRFSINSEGYSRARWDFGDGTPVMEIDPNIEGSLVSHKYNYPGKFTTALTLFNEQGCSKTVQQTLQIGKGYDVMFPNVFSANADGINDYFQGEFTGLASFTFQIFDMWGSLVYSVAYDYNNMPVNWGWNGNYSTGKPYENKSFRYLFVGTTKENNQITKTGEASILR
ncbi:MAG: gliding motility-associated C-terminal domain-containing protein [Arenibacter latericius]|nr:gliding motility-associated C-terminal domain-containing protein [Arenibacter latericius]